MMTDYIEGCAVYRKPSGAVPEDETVKINMRFTKVPGLNNIANAYLNIIFNDREEKKIRMNRAEKKLNIEFSGELKVSRGLYFYYFELEFTDRREYYYKSGRLNYYDNGAEKWQITVYDKDFKTPEFFKGGVMYHIFVDRFAKSGSWTPEIRDGLVMRESTGAAPFYKPGQEGFDVYCGSLAGVIEKLDYLRELSVNIIYLSPVFEAHTNHKYTTSDFEKIDGMFGGDEIFDRLISEADKRGMKIILDGVFNHVGDDSVYFNKFGRYGDGGAYQSKSSKYFDWFTFNDWDNNKDDYECWWGITNVPSIKKDEPLFRAYICGINGVVEKWLKRCAAGWRIDVADELSDRMLRGIRRAAKEMSPDNIVIGEVWEDASNKVAYGRRRYYLQGDQLDSVMNYPLKDAVISYLRTGNSQVMSKVMRMICENYPKPVIDSLMNILGTHDTMRILTALGSNDFTDDKDEQAEHKLSAGERACGVMLLETAAVLQFTLPGFPCIYYCDEAGMESYGPPFSRRFFPWDNIDSRINKFYKRLGKIRSENKIFADGDYELIKERRGLFFYRRVKLGESIYIYTNLSNETHRLGEFDLHEDYASLLTGEPVKEIKACGFDIFK